jgi:hypothetical protein
MLPAPGDNLFRDYWHLTLRVRSLAQMFQDLWLVLNERSNSRDLSEPQTRITYS